MPLCSKPYFTKENEPAPCGQCPGCLTNRKQLWTHRILLESKSHEENSFVTLTYMDDHLPLNSEGTPTLNKRHLTNFIKKLRRRLPQKIRYYAVGEYGTNGSRGINPHFHLCIFGMGQGGAQAVQDSWTVSEKRRKKGTSLGHTLTGTLTPQSAAYVAGYVQKKTKYNKDMYDDLNITPEYSTMSSRPGIGASFIPSIARAVREYDIYTPAGDVPISLQHGTRKLPLGNYMREKLREELNMDCTTETMYNEHTGEVIKEKKVWHGKERQKALYQEEMRILQENEENYDEKFPEDAKVSLKRAIAYRDKQANINFEKRQELFAKRKTL
jgi:hypothetical protein